MSVLYPTLRPSWVPNLIQISVLGAILAGVYGALHDQITYSISPEYFTQLKFHQFRYVNFGLPPRLFVTEIGFLASATAGLFAGWFIARIAVPKFTEEQAYRHSLRAFGIILAFALAGALTGYLLGVLHGSDFPTWSDVAFTLKIARLPAFVTVAYMHNAGYIGALTGLGIAVIRLRRTAGLTTR